MLYPLKRHLNIFLCFSILLCATAITVSGQEASNHVTNCDVITRIENQIKTRHPNARFTIGVILAVPPIAEGQSPYDEGFQFLRSRLQREAKNFSDQFRSKHHNTYVDSGEGSILVSFMGEENIEILNDICPDPRVLTILLMNNGSYAPPPIKTISGTISPFYNFNGKLATWRIRPENGGFIQIIGGPEKLYKDGRHLELLGFDLLISPYAHLLAASPDFVVVSAQ